jgi:tRNA A-37 threonylcarbamoyl transferase component Bud32
MILWDWERRRMIRRFVGHSGLVMSVAISPDGRRALSGGEDKVIRLWDLESGAVIRQLRGHTEWVFSVAFSPDGRLAYSAGGGSEPPGGFGRGGWWDHSTDYSVVRVWDVATGEQVGKMEGRQGMVWCVAVSPDGRRVLSAGNAVILWDAETRAEVRRFDGHIVVAFLPDGRRFVSSSYDGTIRVWHIETGQVLHLFQVHAPSRSQTWLAVSPDGRWLLSSDWAHEDLQLWDIEGRRRVDRIDWGSRPVLRWTSRGTFRCSFAPDGRHVAWGGKDVDIRVYRLSATNDTGLASLPWTRWLTAAMLAVLSLTILLVVRRHHWWNQLGSTWPLRSLAPAVEAAAGRAWATLSSRFLRLETRGAPEELLAASNQAGTARGHPDAVILELFAAGRLRSSEMERVGNHLAECPVCPEVLKRLPEDPMVGMLRDLGDWSDVSPGEPGAGKNRDENAGRFSGAAPHPSQDSGDPGATRPRRPVEEDDVEPRTPEPTQHRRYELKSLLGRGGMGIVYLADDRLENRAVVLKLLREDLLDRPGLVERFRREAAAAALLKHPNIVEAYGAEPFGRWPALVMEYIRGTDLAQLIDKAGPVPVRVGCELIRQAAIGLQYSFEQRMVHRDIKPSNLMVSIDGTVKILDFGLAKIQSELSADAGMTSTDAFLGSVDYMAPEQLDDPRLADIRADIYSLGCTLYHLLSGAPPFQGTALEVLEAHHSREAPTLDKQRPGIPAELAAIVARMMAKPPDSRFQSPREIVQALQRFSGATPTGSMVSGAGLSMFSHSSTLPGG